jgi:hypothetical protein
MSGNLKLNTALGGSVALTPENTASNITVTLPAVTATMLTTATAGVPINGPAFSAKPSTTQTISHNVTTKVTFNTEVFDTNGNFDNVTNYRFTPTVAGYYQVNLNVVYMGTATRNYVFQTQLYKNGASNAVTSTGLVLGTGQDFGASVPAIVYMNGSTDYLEGYVYQFDYTASSSVTLSTLSNFSAALVRSA